MIGRIRSAGAIRSEGAIRAAAVVLGVAAAAGIALYAWVLFAGRGEPACDLCGRPVHPPTAFTAVAGGRTVEACCPRCGLTLCDGEGGDVRDARVTDFPTGERVPAESCVFVVGGDLAPCCTPAIVVADEKAHLEKCFDRCSPSAIAFRDPKEALLFSKEHGGEIVPYETLVKTVRTP